VRTCQNCYKALRTLKFSAISDKSPSTGWIEAATSNRMTRRYRLRQQMNTEISLSNAEQVERDDSPASLTNKPEVRVLIPMIEDWPSIARLPKALHAAGFKVAALCSADAWLTKTKYVDQVFVLPRGLLWSLLKPLWHAARNIAPPAAIRSEPRWIPSAKRMIPALGNVAFTRVIESLIKTVRQWRPDFMICGDELSRRLLNSIVHSAGECRLMLPPDVMAMIKRSLGDSRYFAPTTQKSALYEVAYQIGVRQPHPTLMSAAEDLDHFAARFGYPVVLKRDFLTSGAGVLICHDRNELHTGFQRLRGAQPNDGAYARLLASFSDTSAVRERAQITAHTFIKGTAGLCGVAALDGRLLASFTAIKLEVRWQNGPSSTIKFSRNEEMETAAARLIKALGFSGIGEVEFVVEDGTGHAYLMEFNPRPAPTSHLGGIAGADLCQALHNALCGSFRPDAFPASTQGERTVALFPQEWMRDPASFWLSRIWHDVPWEDPALLTAFIHEGTQSGRPDPGLQDAAKTGVKTRK
jgi:hypothetical protein